MATVGAFEAKTHFSQLLTKVIKGETIIITKHGEPVAKLIAISKEQISSNQAVNAVKNIRQLRKGNKLGKNLKLKDLITEGRKR